MGIDKFGQKSFSELNSSNEYSLNRIISLENEVEEIRSNSDQSKESISKLVDLNQAAIIILNKEIEQLEKNINHNKSNIINIIKRVDFIDTHIENFKNSLEKQLDSYSEQQEVNCEFLLLSVDKDHFKCLGITELSITRKVPK